MSGNNAFYYVDNAYYAALEGLEDEAVAPRAAVPNPYKLWDKKTIRSRRSKASNLRSLKDLCLKSVASNMDSIWCKDYVENWSGQNLAFLLGPFEQLAGTCIYELMSELRNKNSLHFRYLPTLVTGNLQTLDLMNVKNINKILNAIKYRCQNNLRTLNLENCLGMTESVLSSTLANLKKLEQLNLRGTDISDSTLEQISLCTFPLRCLQLSDNEKVTSDGVKKLCKTHFADHLTAISLDFTSVDIEGLQLLLEALPKLQVLEHPLTASAVLQLKMKCSNKTLQLRQLKLNPADFNIDELYLMVLACPYLSDLSFLTCQGISTDALLPFLDAKNLNSFVSDNSVLPEISWFMHVGNSLTKIEISGTAAGGTQFDLTVMGKFCPSLQIILLHKVNLVESKVSDELIPSFCNLRRVSLANVRLCNNVVNSLQQILTAAHNLLVFELFLFTIPVGFLAQICAESIQDSRILSHLHTVSFVKCEDLTDMNMNSLICCAPRLKEIHFHRNANSYYIENFLAQNKLPIQLICDKTVDGDDFE